MARQAAIKTMTVDALVELRTKVTRELAHRSKQLQEQLEHIVGYTNGARQTTGNGRHHRLKGKSVPVTHRGPEPGQEWRGRGMMPRWMQALIKQGHSPDEYLVGAAKAAAASKKTATKKSASRKMKRRAARKTKTAS
jgi:DNA-binding protein H-NS